MKGTQEAIIREFLQIVYSEINEVKLCLDEDTSLEEMKKKVKTLKYLVGDVEDVVNGFIKQEYLLKGERLY